MVLRLDHPVKSAPPGRPRGGVDRRRPPILWRPMETPTVDLADLRFDELSGAPVLVTPGRQGRPNLPPDGCPFCVGGLEAPEPYTTRAFPNRWPPLGTGRAEILLYTPDHDASLWQLGRQGVARVVDLWADRTEALGRARRRRLRAGVREPRRRGRRHHRPPPRPGLRARRHRRRRPRRAAPGGPPRVRAVPAAAARAGGGRVRRMDGLGAPCQRLPLRPAARTRRPPPRPAHARRPAAGRPRRPARRRPGPVRPASSRGPCPTCVGSTSAPPTAPTGPSPTCTSTSSRRLRAPGVLRHVAAGELGSGLYLNPVRPEDAAATLRAAVPPAVARRRRGAPDVPGLGTRAGQPHRRPHRLRRRPGPAHGDRPGGGGHRRPGRRLGHARLRAVRRRGRDPPGRPGRPRLRRAAAGPATWRRWWPRWTRPTASPGTLDSTLPPGGGLASSAAVEVAVAAALGADLGDPLALAQMCQRAEERAVGVPCGIMDQLVAAAGVAGAALRIDCRTLDIEPGPAARGGRGGGDPLRRRPRAGQDRLRRAPGRVRGGRGGGGPVVARPHARRRRGPGGPGAAAARPPRDHRERPGRRPGRGPERGPDALRRRADGRQPREPARRLRGVHAGHRHAGQHPPRRPGRVRRPRDRGRLRRLRRRPVPQRHAAADARSCGGVGPHPAPGSSTSTRPGVSPGPPGPPPAG